MKTWLNQLYQRCIRLFKSRTKIAEIPLPEPLPAPPSTPAATQGQGLKCPECKSAIPVSIPLLLSGGPFVCPGCGLRLNVNRGESQSALGALAKLDVGMKKARQASGQS
jgi:hypothetical protein